MKIKLVGPDGHSLKSRLKRFAKYLVECHKDYDTDAYGRAEFIKWADFALKTALKNMAETAMVEMEK